MYYENDIYSFLKKIHNKRRHIHVMQILKWHYFVYYFHKPYKRKNANKYQDNVDRRREGNQVHGNRPPIFKLTVAIWYSNISS